MCQLDVTPLTDERIALTNQRLGRKLAGGTCLDADQPRVCVNLFQPRENKMFRKSSFVVVLTVPVLLVLLLLSTWFASAGAPSATPRSPDTPAAVNTDDQENTTPTAWWVYSGQTVSDIVNTLTTHNARIVDIYVESLAQPRRFTVTYVSNTGAYAKGWWWYFDVDETALSNALTANNARLISLKAYDIGGGQIRFAAVMIPNTGADAKTGGGTITKQRRSSRRCGRPTLPASFRSIRM